MPQMNKGGKFTFGKSVIKPNGAVRIPPRAVAEYEHPKEKSIYSREVNRRVDFA